MVDFSGVQVLTRGCLVPYLCRMKTPITYYGGKQTMLRHIAPLLPVHHLYCEPFFGGGAVFFAKRPSRIEVMNDKDGFVMNFYRQVQSNFVALQGLLSETLHSRLAYTHAQHIRSAPAYFSALDQAWSFWVLCNMSLGTFYMRKRQCCSEPRYAFIKEAVPQESLSQMPLPAKSSANWQLN